MLTPAIARADKPIPLLPGGQFNFRRLTQALRERYECEHNVIRDEDARRNSDGTQPALHEFARIISGERLSIPVYVQNENHAVTHDQIERVCRALRIDDTRDLTHWTG